jgi:release factor glutamine methyltransferase
MSFNADRDASAKLNLLLQNAIVRLSDAGIDNSRLDAEILLAFAAGLTREGLYAHAIACDDALCERFEALIRQRALRTPLAYITGKREFYSLELKVSPKVLIPRPETEIVVELALRFIDGHPSSRVIDLCTGSGAIALAIAANSRDASVVATDISSSALEIAARNAGRLELATKVEFRRADCWTVIDNGTPLGRFDLIVANPPYIREDEIGALAPEVRNFEPRIALAGGRDGLDFYRRIAIDAPDHLTPGGALIVEVGRGQALEVTTLCRAAGFLEIAMFNDMAGIERVVQARLPKMA